VELILDQAALLPENEEEDKCTNDSVGGEGSRFSRKRRYLNVILGKLDYKLSFFFTMGIYSFCGLNVFPKY
jgi:hypothetical protein